MNTKLCLGLVICSIGQLAWAGDEWINVIPADAKAAIVVRDPKLIRQAIQTYFESFEKRLLAEQSFDEVLRKAGFTEELDLKRGLGIVIVEPGQRGIVFVLPVNNEGAALRQLKAEPAGKNFHKAELYGIDWMIFAKPGVLMAATNVELLQPFRKSTRSLTEAQTERQRKLLSDSEIYWHVNVAEWRVFLHMGALMVEVGVMTWPFRDLIAPLLLYDDPDTLDLLQIYFRFYRMLIDQISAVAIGVRMVPDRTIIETEIAFDKDSEIRALAARVPAPQSGLLAGLSDSPFFVAMAADTSGFRPMASSFFNSMLRLPMNDRRLTAEQRSLLLGKLAGLYDESWGFNAMVDLGDGKLSYVGHQLFRDSKRTPERTEDVLTAFNTFLWAFGPMEVSRSLAAARLGGRDVMATDIKMFKAIPPGSQTIFESVYGTELKLQLFASGNTLAIGADSSANPIERLVKFPPLIQSERIKVVMDDLPRDAFCVILVDPHEFLRLVEKCLQKHLGTKSFFKFPSVQLPIEPVPPIGIAVKSTSEGFRLTCVIRADSGREIMMTYSKWLVEILMQFDA